MRTICRLAQAAMIAASMLAPFASSAQDAGDEPDQDALDVTMKLMPQGATLPEAVTRVIELPETASGEARENAADGLQRANEARDARENGPPGLEVAAEAREGLRGRPDNPGRGGGPNGPTTEGGERPGPPDGVPGLPDGVPGPPETPPGQSDE